ncbi:MAG: imidazole glycerol phosphate synthase subunit HisH [Trueperella sp.]|nr:imidazole glycerol phosphate synthase subunit HisH [Trueperella sp.]
MKIVVFNIGLGNVRSVVRALEHVGAEVSLTADPDAALNAPGLVVPGVGAYGAVMAKLRAARGDRIIERRLAGGQPVLGICVGLQIMFERGNELGVTEGLGQWPGEVDRLPAEVVPHMGWSPVKAPAGSVLLAGLDGERFYFLHSYAALTNPAEGWSESEVFAAPRVATAHYGVDFVAAVEQGPLSATQFHPEKSSDAGMQLLENWLSSLA